MDDATADHLDDVCDMLGIKGCKSKNKKAKAKAILKWKPPEIQFMLPDSTVILVNTDMTTHEVFEMVDRSITGLIGHIGSTRR